MERNNVLFLPVTATYVNLAYSEGHTTLQETINMKQNETFHGTGQDLPWNKTRSSMEQDKIFHGTRQDLLWKLRRSSMEVEKIFYGGWEDLLWKLRRSSMEVEKIFYGGWEDLLWRLRRSSMEVEKIFYGSWEDLLWKLRRSSMEVEKIFNGSWEDLLWKKTRSSIEEDTGRANLPLNRTRYNTYLLGFTPQLLGNTYSAERGVTVVSVSPHSSSCTCRCTFLLLLPPEVNRIHILYINLPYSTKKNYKDLLEIM